MDRKTPSSAAISHLAVAFLDLGRTIAASGHKVFQVGQSKPQPAVMDEAAAMDIIRGDRYARNIIEFRDSEPDETQVRILSVVLYLGFCADNHPSVRLVSELVGRESPRDIMLCRGTIRRMVERQILNFRNGTEAKPWNGILLLSSKTLTTLGLCNKLSPIFTEKTLANQSPAANGDGTMSKTAIRNYIPPAEVIYDRIRETVKGAYIESAIRTISATYFTHLHRARMIAGDKHPGTPNLVTLLIGSPSSGKTHIAATASKVITELSGEASCPYIGFSATSLTQEGYVGSSISDFLESLVAQCDGNVAKVRSSTVFIDEFDKKMCHTSRDRLDIGGRAVQEELLVVLSGGIVPVGGRRNTMDKQTRITTDGMQFLLGGSFQGLDKFLCKRRKNQIGFIPCVTADDRKRTRDGLVEYGLIPELVSRLGSIVVIPDPGVADMREILISPGGLLTCYGKLWAGMGMEVTLENGGIDATASWGIDTRSFARGMQSILNRLTEQLVGNGDTGKIRLGEREIRDVINAMGTGG